MKMALNYQARPIQPLSFKVWSFNSSLNNRCSSNKTAVQGQPASFNSSRLRFWVANFMPKMRTTRKRSWMLTSPRNSWNCNSSNSSSSTRAQATRRSRDVRILTNNSMNKMRRTEMRRAKMTMRWWLTLISWTIITASCYLSTWGKSMTRIPNSSPSLRS